MTKNHTVQDGQDVGAFLKSFEGDAASFRRLFERITRSLPASQVMVVSSLPRGGLQIVQPANCPEPLLKGYSREMHAEDRATWQSVLRNKPLLGEQCWEEGAFEPSPYKRQWMEPNGLQFLVVAPLSAPVLPGYPGALHLYRSAAEGQFTPADCKALGQIAQQLDEALIENRSARATRHAKSCELSSGACGPACCRQFVFQQDGKQVPIYEAHDGREPIDAQLAKEMRRHAERQFQHVNGELMTADRVQLPDSTGTLWTFRTVVYKSYPALGKGAYVFLCLQPEPCEWELVRPADFQADSELMRLVPTLRFMRDEFPRTPTLDEIAARAHLSPFHFHRRFTELLGLTPKHFLLGCQIQRAKALLLERKTPLAEIATGCGFAHQSHFTSRFKQATGLTPTRWRRLATDRQQKANEKPLNSKTPGCAA